MFSCFPGRLPFVSHRLTDGQFRGCHQGPKRFWFWRQSLVRSCSWIVTSGLLSCLIGRFVAGYSYMCWNPTELNLPSLVSEPVERSYGFGQDILSGGALRVCHRLDGGFIVRKDGALARSVCRCVYVKSYLECQFYPFKFCCIYCRGG